MKKTTQELQRKIRCFKHRVADLPRKLAELNEECSFLQAVTTKPEKLVEIAAIASELATLQDKTERALQAFSA